MFSKRELFDKICHELTVFFREIEYKSNNGLLDDNIFAEYLVKDLLNICCGWELHNLNDSICNYPGIDLGDDDRRIGVQVTSTKTSKKIRDSLYEITTNSVYEKYDQIYFFILGSKQKRYSVEFGDYPVNCGINNIWDISDLIDWCKTYDKDKINKIWDIIRRDLVINDANMKTVSPNIIIHLLDLKHVLQKIFNAARCIANNPNWYDWLDREVDNISLWMDELFNYLDIKTYNACCETIERWTQLKEAYASYCKSGKKYMVSFHGEYILENEQLIKNLDEAISLLRENIVDYKDGIDAIIDGEDLLERLVGIGLDINIVYKQFSFEKFLNCLEDLLIRKIQKGIVIFPNNSRYYETTFIDRILSEGTIVKKVDDVLSFSDYMKQSVHSSIELAFITSHEALLGDIDSRYLYTVSFNNDLNVKIKPLFYVCVNIDEGKLSSCFNYKEQNQVNLTYINYDIFRDLLSNANDNIRHQLRVTWSGDVYISTITGSEDIQDIKFRWESWDANNNYVGPFAASNSIYVEGLYRELLDCWSQGAEGYIDY